LDEIRVLIANGENHEAIAEQFGIPAGYVIEHENGANHHISKGEFIRRFHARHPEVNARR
jgi:hypothetical protein